MLSKFTYIQIHQILNETDSGAEVKAICRKYGSAETLSSTGRTNIKV
jgi:hypothetical protein